MSKILIDALEHLQEKLADTQGSELYQKIVNEPFETFVPIDLDIGTIVFLIDDVESGFIKRIALSKTPAAAGAVNASAKPFNEIEIPRDYEASAHVRAIKSRQPVVVTEWYEMFAPALTRLEANDNQAGAGIEVSVVQPYFGAHVSGTIIFSLYCSIEKINDKHYSFFKNYADIVETLL